MLGVVKRTAALETLDDIPILPERSSTTPTAVTFVHFVHLSRARVVAPGRRPPGQNSR